MGRPKKLVATEEVVEVTVENAEDTVEIAEETLEVVEEDEVTEESVTTEETLEVVEAEESVTTEETPVEVVKENTVVVDNVDPTVTYGIAKGCYASDYVYETPTVTVYNEPEAIKVQSLSDLRHNNPRANVIKASRACDGASGVRISTKVAKLF